MQKCHAALSHANHAIPGSRLSPSLFIFYRDKGEPGNEARGDAMSGKLEPENEARGDAMSEPEV